MGVQICKVEVVKQVRRRRGGGRKRIIYVVCANVPVNGSVGVIVTSFYKAKVKGGRCRWWQPLGSIFTLLCQLHGEGW